MFIADTATNYAFAGSRLMEKRKRLHWTPFAAHCIDLMLLDSAKMKAHDQTFSNARQL